MDLVPLELDIEGVNTEIAMPTLNIEPLVVCIEPLKPCIACTNTRCEPSIACHRWKFPMGEGSETDLEGVDTNFEGVFA